METLGTVVYNIITAENKNDKSFRKLIKKTCFTLLYQPLINKIKRIPNFIVKNYRSTP